MLSSWATELSRQHTLTQVILTQKYIGSIRTTTGVPAGFRYYYYCIAGAHPDSSSTSSYGSSSPPRAGAPPPPGRRTAGSAPPRCGGAGGPRVAARASWCICEYLYLTYLLLYQ